MKIRLPFPLLAALLAALASVVSSSASSAPAADLGNVMYVGDSITHGVDSGSWRWALHQIFADNGISYQEQGVNTGNYSGGVTAGTVYGGRVFNNVHSSEASARTYEISGRKSGPRFGGSNIQNWLGQTSWTTNGNYYQGPVFAGEQAPDTFFLLTGTNDLLSDGNLSDQGRQTLLDDMDTIVDSMQKANGNADIIVLSIPCWTEHSNSNDSYYHEAVATYNRQLQAWGDGRAGVTVVDVNRGMTDVASSTPFYGVGSMFRAPGSDGLHPSAQGDLLMAGNVARALGYAGRSAGQERKAAHELAVNFGQTPSITQQALADRGFTATGVTVSGNTIHFGGAGSSTLSRSWQPDADLSRGFTFDFNLVLGDGEANGWNVSDQFSVSLGNGSFYGTLNINEAYIQWGETVLYSTDMSANTENLRLAYVAGNELEGLKGGYYVWLGDMLIGEALSVTSGSVCNGVMIQYDGSGNAILKDLSMDGTGSYAPTTSGLIHAENAFVSSGPDAGGSASTPEGNLAWPETGFTHKALNQDCSGTFNARSQADASAGGAGNSVNLSITSGTATYVYANSGNYTGDVWLTISNEGGASAWYAAHGAFADGGTLAGNAALRFTDAAAGGSTVFGAVNASGVTGNVYLEFSAENASFGTFSSTNASSVVGSYATDIGGNVDVVVNTGSFSHQVMGGIFANAAGGTTTIGGDTHVYVNGGAVNGDVVGGGLTGTIEGSAGSTVTGGSIAGSIYGAGKGGEIRQGSAVRVTGGTIKGNVYAGGAGGNIQGNTAVTVAGNAAVLHNGNAWGSISGGGSGGAVNGSSVVRIQDLSSGTETYGFDKYAGTISGGTNVTGTRSLVLDHVTVDHFQAALTDFTHVSAVNRTRTTLDSLGGAHTLSMEAGSSLVVNGVSGLTKLILGEHASLTLQGLTADMVTVDITGSTNYTLSLTEIPASLDNIQFLNDGVLYDAAMSTDPQAHSALVFAQVPEPGSASLGLAGLAVLLWRRRRKMSH